MPAQGDVALAKDDTRLLATGVSITACTTDLSHLADDLSAGTSCVYEADSARWSEATLPWALDLAARASSSSAGYLYTHEAGGAGLRLTMSAGPVLEARVDGLLVASLTLTGIGGSAESLAITWSCETNPFATGAGNAARSELRAFNATDGSYTQVVATHALPTDATGQAIWGASATVGTNAFSGSITTIRWSVGRFHPAAETREDLVGLTSAPTLEFETRREQPVPTRASGLGDDGHFAGPCYQAVAASLRGADLRQVGAVISELYRDAPTLDSSPPAVRALAAPDGSGVTLLGQYLAHRPVPRTVNRLAVRVHVQAWRVDVSPPDDVRIRVYSCSRPPGAGLVGQPVVGLVAFSQEITVTSADGSGTTGGQWYDFAPLPIARDAQQGTWLMLGFVVEDAGGGGVADQRWRVRAWTVEPGVVDAPGALPLGGFV